MESDIWSVTKGADADFYVESVTPTDDSALTLANTQPAYHGVAYQVSITSVDNETGVDFTIVGLGADGSTITEVLAGGNNTTVYSTNYFVSVTSVTPSGATTDAITVGYGGNMALPKTRIKQVYYVAGSSAGSIVVTKQSNSEVILNLATPSLDDVSRTVVMPSAGLLTVDGINNYATVATTNVTSLTVFCA